jgi:hypothetical protein
MSGQHTPGPWEWDGPVWDYDPETEAPWLIPVNDDTRAVLTGEIKCSNEANARLIAAAPDLLAALIEANEGSKLYEGHLGRWAAVIAKASPITTDAGVEG